MKQLLHTTIAVLISFTAFSQASSNTCLDAIANSNITADGIYSVGTIDGDAPGTGTGGTMCSGGNIVASNGEWFTLTFTESKQVTVSSAYSGNSNSGKDTRLQIFEGSCFALQCIAGSDDFNSLLLSEATFTAQANTTYFIAWDDRWGNSSNFDFQVSSSQSASSVSFTNQILGVTGTRRATVDMNGDFLDDIVSISQNEPNVPEPNDRINIRYQQPGGGFASTSSYYLEFDYTTSWSLAAGDFDANGYNDLVFGTSQGTNVIKANNSGTGYSMAYSESNIFTQRTNFVDINNDGHLDVFVCHDVDPNVYWINDGNGNLDFHRGADSNGVPEGLGIVPDGGNYGSIWIDYDNDHDIDLFIAKCGGGTDGQKNYNELFRNNGNGSFTNITNPTNQTTNPGSVVDPSGLRDAIQTWSSAWGDYDNDGDMDVYVGSSSSDPNKLMRNNGDGTFTDISVSSGISTVTTKGIENTTHDFNNDGYIDILTNGKMLLNNGDGTFQHITSGIPASGSVGDLNNDGYLDVFNSQIYYNTSQNIENNNWLKIVTIGNQSNRNGIGARVEISSPGIGTQIRDVRSGDGFRFMSTLNTHFGLGKDNTVSQITIYWPSGVVDQLTSQSVNQVLTITEGSYTLSNDLITDNTTFSIHPNPAKNIINIKTNIQFSNDAYYSIFDIAGRRVLNAYMENSIDVSKLAAGNYVLRIISDGKVLTKKFIKE